MRELGLENPLLPLTDKQVEFPGDNVELIEAVNINITNMMDASDISDMD